MTLNINEQTVKALRVAGQSFPIPSVATAACVALSILEITQMVKSNKEEFIAIGRDSCIIVETVIQRVQMGQNVPQNVPAMLWHAGVLVADLRYIKKRVKKIKGQSGLKKIFGRQHHQDTIRNCRECLMHSMALFGFQNDVEVRGQLATVHNLLITTLGALSHPPIPGVRPQQQWQIPSPSFCYNPIT